MDRMPFHEFGNIYRRFVLVRILFDKVKPKLVAGRPYDLTHTGEMLLIMDKILQQEKVSEDEALALFLAVVLHDIGDAFIKDSVQAAVWDDTTRRTEHMRLGADFAKGILKKMQFAPHIIDQVVHLVATHDEIYLGKPPQEKLQRLLRAADAEFILTRHSFIKDLFSRVKKDCPQDIMPEDAKGFLKEQADKYIVRDAYLYPPVALTLMKQNYVDRLVEIARAEQEAGFLQLLCRRVQYVHKVIPKLKTKKSEWELLPMAYILSCSRDILDGRVDFMLDPLHSFH